MLFVKITDSIVVKRANGNDRAKEYPKGKEWCFT